MRIANCWIVAMWIWFMARFRSYAWVTRSHSFRGMIPHFGVADRSGWRYLRIIEYIPPKRDLWTSRNWLLLFRGSYRVWHVRVMGVRRFSTRQQAMDDFLKKGRHGQPAPAKKVG